MRRLTRFAAMAAFALLASTACTDDRVEIGTDAGTDSGQVDAGPTSDTGPGSDAGSSDGGEVENDMGVVRLPPGPDRIVPGVSGDQRLGSDQYRLGVSVGAPGGPTLESTDYRLRLGTQPHLVRPGAQPAPSE